MRSTTVKFATLLAAALLAPVAASADTTVFAAGINGPIKLDVTHHGTLVVSERGTGNNNGRLLAVDRNGAVRPLISGLPSGIEVTNAPSGPGPLELRGGCCVLELAISEVDTLRFGSAPGQQVPNPVGVSSPILSSLLQVVFNRPIDHLTGGFVLTRAQHNTIADGHTVTLANDSGEKAWISLKADLKDFWPDPATNVRGSNPFGVAKGRGWGSTLLTDAGQNSIVEVGLFGPPKTLYRFPQITNAPGTRPPASDAVPTGIRHYYGDKYLVSFLTGVPFVPGSASVQLFDAGDRTVAPFISGLNTVTDILKVGGAIYVLEISTNLSAGAPGRLLRFATASSAPEVVAAPLIGGSGMTYSPSDNAIYVAEVFTGRIMRIGL
jgi:hypothetical protein